MAEVTGGNLAIIYDTTATGYAPIATGNNNLISMNIDLRVCKQLSVQIFSSGGAIVNWTLQVTNLPPSLMNYGRKLFGAALRDDTYTSAHWSNVNTGKLLATGQLLSVIVPFTTSAHRDGRVLFNWDAANGGGATSNIFAHVLTFGAG